jgi:hypothetical protein
VATIKVSGAPIVGGDITASAGGVWARATDPMLAHIDPATNTLVERFGPTARIGSVAVDDSAIWVSAHDAGAVWRLP